jgi:uncharacterized protein
MRLVSSGGSRRSARDDDPYCPEGAALLSGDRLGIPVDVVAGGAHLNTAGYGPWPAIETWSLAATAMAPNLGRRHGSMAHGCF